ncbi:MAG TPA: hypothetical protein VL485_13210 [Ktedonobacteraceae bacterium]|nr:hypothetical protein [Ktedonobacteraceae bacterium]
MEKVLIVAKTRAHEGLWCVGALTLSSNRSLRLLTRLGAHQPQDTPLEVGQIWEMSWRRAYDPQPPHVEDVRVLEQKFVGLQTNLYGTLLQRVRPWLGSPERLFDGRIVLNGAAAYICKSAGLPARSTGFWLPERPLVFCTIRGRPYYALTYGASAGPAHMQHTLRIAYVGGEHVVPEIPADALIRVSLARWWKLYENEEKKCYLQLSGWYLSEVLSR